MPASTWDQARERFPHILRRTYPHLVFDTELLTSGSMRQSASTVVSTLGLQSRKAVEILEYHLKKLYSELDLGSTTWPCHEVPDLPFVLGISSHRALNCGTIGSSWLGASTC